MVRKVRLEGSAKQGIFEISLRDHETGNLIKSERSSCFGTTLVMLASGAGKDHETKKFFSVVDPPMISLGRELEAGKVFFAWEGDGGVGVICCIASRDAVELFREREDLVVLALRTERGSLTCLSGEEHHFSRISPGSVRFVTKRAKTKYPSFIGYGEHFSEAIRCAVKAMPTR